MDETALTALERGLMELIREGGEQASWYWLGKRVGPRGLPVSPDMMTVLRALLARGLVARRDVGGGNDRWWLTPLGDAVLDRRFPAGPLSPARLVPLVAALRGELADAMGAVLPLIRADGSIGLWEALRQALAVDEATAANATTAALAMALSERGPWLRELAADPRVAVRAAMFEALAPGRIDGPGRGPFILPADELAALVREGLLDREPAVQLGAAKLAFAAGCGDAARGELIAVIEAPARELRWYAILALGSAGDALSLELLHETVDGADEMLAGAAARALATRPDGRARWLRALDDPRASVVDAALFALSHGVPELDPDTLAALREDARPAVRAALTAFLRRQAPPAPRIDAGR